ncbi:unnamed protein product [Meloidogyne enterolobii]|uniref:Uncharacterized protein n=1 Tax=Meloidogyne enterolobii TaxID=390850 RepID=A0ACB1AEL3_MELEN
MYVDPDSGRTIRMQKDPTNTKFIRPTRGWENIEFVVSERRHTHEVLRPNDGNGLGVDFLRRHTQPTIYGNVHELEQQAQELAQFRRRSSHAIGFGSNY